MDENQTSEDQFKANADVTPSRRRWWRSRAVTLVLAVLAGLVALGLAGAAYATYDYARDYRNQILPGSSIAGVDVSGMGFEQALAAVKVAVEPQLNRTLTVTYGDKSWETTPSELGAHSNAKAAVEAALQASEETSFLHKMRLRLLGEEFSFTRDVAISYPRRGARAFIDGLAEGFDREVREAEIDYSTGWVEITKERIGRKVQRRKSREALRAALESDASVAGLAVKTIVPEESEQDFDQVLLVRIGENKLYLYEDGEITQSWPVATGQPEYMTPTGLYEVTLKRYMPTWVNPAPDTWGADMPESIPPGPGNPLGLRAINWSAPAIRFHGTSAIYSLGYNASHGCVRMSNEDVIELYDLIDEGTPIVSLIAGELKPLYAASPDPIVVPEDSSEANADEVRRENAEGEAAEEDSRN